MHGEEDVRLSELFSLLDQLGAERLEADYDEFGMVQQMRYLTADGILLAEGVLQLRNGRAVGLCNGMIATAGVYFPRGGTMHLQGGVRRRCWFVK